MSSGSLGRIFQLMVCCSLVVSVLCACSERPASEPTSLDTDVRRFSYAMGVKLGETLRPMEMGLDAQTLQDGLSDAINGRPVRMNERARADVLAKMSQSMLDKQRVRQAEELAHMKAAGERFLSENARRKGVHVLPSGLQYEVLDAGRGSTHPSSSDTVEVIYQAMHLNGQPFENNHDASKRAVTVAMDQAIAGWREGLQLMVPGARFKFYVPPHLAYGDEGGGLQIQGGETLMFEVELLAIRPAVH